MSDRIKKAQARAAELIAEATQQEVLAVLLPAEPYMITGAATWKAPYVSYKAETLTEALVVYRAYREAGIIEPSEDWRGTFRSVAPAVLNSEANKQGSKLVDFVAVWLCLEGFSGHRKASLQFYVKLSNGHHVKVSIEIEKPNYQWFPRIASERNGWGEWVRWDVTPAANLGHYAFKYSSESGNYHILHCWDMIERFDMWAAEQEKETA